MKSVLLRSAFLSTLGLSLGAFPVMAAENARAVGVVDVQGAILKTDQGQAERAKIEKEFNLKREDILKQEQQLKKMSDDFAVQQSILSEADKMNKQKEFQAKLQKYQKEQVDFEQEARQRETAALQGIFQNMQKEVQTIAKKKNLDMVVDKSAGVLLYAANPVDITEEVIKSYNEHNKVK